MMDNDVGRSGSADRATHEPSPDGLGHSVGIANAWQPIETAPKDGTPLLLWATREGWEQHGHSRVVGYWDTYSWSIAGAGGPEPKASVNADGTQDWKVQRLDNCAPTHWMPLPEPPQ